jgi:hypothetical protein
MTEKTEHRITIGQLMLGVAIAALGFAVLPISARHSWWEIKPFLNLVLLPMLALVFSLRSPRTSAIWAVMATDLFFLALWFLAQRPYAGPVLMGYSIEDPIHSFEHSYFTLEHSLARSLYWMAYFYYDSGGVTDLAVLVLVLSLLAIVLRRPIPQSLRVVTVGLIGLVKLYDCLALPRVRPYDPTAWLNPAETPLRLIRLLLAGEQTSLEFWSNLGRVRPLEFVALVVVFVYLLTVAILLRDRHAKKGPDG